MKRLLLLAPMALAMAWAQPYCSMDTLRGTYVVSYYGATIFMQQGAAPATTTGGIVGVVSIGYDGSVAGIELVSGIGPVSDWEVAGTIQLTGNCTGAISLKVKPKGAPNWVAAEVDRFVADPEGKALTVIMVDIGPGIYPAVQGTWKKISAAPDAASL